MTEEGRISPPGTARENRKRERTEEARPGRRWEADISTIRVVFGEGRVREVGNLVLDLECRRVLLVSDPGIRQAGHVGVAEEALQAAAVKVFTFDTVGENPSTREVEEGVEFAAPHQPDCIVALGGGSAMDCAKGVNLLLTNGGEMADYWGFGRAKTPLLPAIGIPTTAGTGSEAQSFALISDVENHRKMACGDHQARFRSVILDPGLLASAPTTVAAASGLDAVSHAVESFVTTRRNPVSDMLARKAWSLLESQLEEFLSDRASVQARGRVMLASHLAGAAIEQSMLGAAHACANPLTAAFGITHGLAVALMLPHVVRFNSAVVDDDYQKLADLADFPGNGDAGEAVARRIESMRAAAELPKHLQELGVSKAELPALAESAALEWTARFNPRPVSQAELLAIYEAAF